MDGSCLMTRTANSISTGLDLELREDKVQLPTRDQKPEGRLRFSENKPHLLFQMQTEIQIEERQNEVQGMGDRGQKLAQLDEKLLVHLA